MLQIIVTIFVLVLVLGGLLAISLSRSEDKQLKKSCGCSVPGPNGKTESCAGSCEN